MQAGDAEPVSLSNVVLQGNKLTAEIEGQRHSALLSSHSYHDEQVMYCNTVVSFKERASWDQVPARCAQEPSTVPWLVCVGFLLALKLALQGLYINSPC